MSGATAMRLRRRPGLAASVVHRLSGIALSIFLPLHFIALGTAISGAASLDRFMALTANPLAKALECGLVVALAAHLSCGLRVLAIEFAGWHDRTATSVAACFAIALATGALFLLSVTVG
jgi:fumarate reductase subunit D